MRTPIAVQTQIVNADGTQGAGVICVKPEPNAVTLIVNSGAPVCGLLDVQGRLVSQMIDTPLTVWASDDTYGDSVPFNTIYVCQANIVGQEYLEFRAYVPKASTATELAAQTSLLSPTVTLTSLIAGAAMLGQPIVGDNWDDGTIVIAFSGIYNTVTLSNDATASGECEATIGGCVNWDTLVENAL
jgi:hypothetical protein